MSQNITGRLRGFQVSEAEVGVQIKDDQVVFAKCEGWGNMRMGSLLAEASASGTDVLVFHEDVRFFVDVDSTPNEVIKVQNGSLISTFTEDLCETFPDEKAQNQIGILLVAIHSYPCSIQVKPEIVKRGILKVRRDSIHYI